MTKETSLNKDRMLNCFAFPRMTAIDTSRKPYVIINITSLSYLSYSCFKRYKKATNKTFVTPITRVGIRPAQLIF